MSARLRFHRASCQHCGQPLVMGEPAFGTYLEEPALDVEDVQVWIVYEHLEECVENVAVLA